MYLTASRPDIMFATCVCARYQTTPKESHLAAVNELVTKMARTLLNKTILYTSYSVRRKDSHLYALCDADLQNLCVFDLVYMYKVLQNYINNGKMAYSRRTYATSLNRLREVMRAQVIFHSKTDFDLGYWLVQDKMCISPPRNRPLWILRMHIKSIGCQLRWS
ncbi:hypothetical protein OSB04_011314 [Centaurea solstitialis]|uniref:Uncharacterized protein n=1 Tax=Centaurea solstitialis TaxID=347529 RepID=A0AA38WLE3_9ASTR|nr:hypothetical protein OSB04_011314 [Centaurea solstitialis]